MNLINLNRNAFLCICYLRVAFFGLKHNLQTSASESDHLEICILIVINSQCINCLEQYLLAKLHT